MSLHKPTGPKDVIHEFDEPKRIHVPLDAKKVKLVPMTSLTDSLLTDILVELRKISKLLESNRDA